MAYNAFNQLVQIQTRVNGAPTVDLNYQYPAGQNNGQISGVATGLPADQAGLNATYSYDGLKRLQSVTRAAGTQQYAYDGWGNLSGKTGLGANFTLYADPMTNRLAGGGLCYDANGNLISTGQQCAAEYGYDLRNRLARVAVTTSGQPDLSAELYYYTEDNKRVTTVRPNGTTNQVFYVYGAKNEIAAICTAQILGQAPACDPRDVRFAGRMIRQNFYPVVEDRVGSVIANPWTSYGSTPPKQYLPYGEQLNYPQSGTAFPGNTNFATYFHDATTGLDYADQRFYNSQYGRFMSADPSQQAASALDSGSWNKYSYVRADPINFNDPEGLSMCSAENSYGDCGGDAHFWGGGFGDSYANAGRLGYTPSMSPLLWAGLQQYLVNVAANLPLVPPSTSFPTDLTSVIWQTTNPILSSLGLTSEQIAAVSAGLTASLDPTGGHYNLTISQAGLAAALCPQTAGTCQAADNLWSTFNNAWNGFRDNQTTNSGHIKLDSIGNTLEFHVDCYNNTAGASYSILHGFVDVLYGTFVNGSISLDKACGIVP